MKKICFFVLGLLLWTYAFAQDSTSACPGLKNPASFTSGSTSGQYVGYYSGQTGNKPYIAPDALTGTTGVNMTSAIIPAARLAATTGNGGTSYCGSTLNPTNRFRIMSSTDGPGTGTQAGNDPLVNYNLPYCPTPYGTDFVRSIRLGNCGTNAEAEALYYTMDVHPENAFLLVYYAIVIQAPGHGQAGDPSFVIRVAKQQDGQWQQISDTLCYAVSSSGLVNGTDGWHSYNGNGGNGFYRDWNKIAVNLNDYLYEQVRIEIYVSDCAAYGHYGYCYIGGECLPMEISTAESTGGDSPLMLKAPKGMDNYVWYKSNRGADGIGDMSNVPDSINFTQLTPNTNTDSTYICTLEDFRIIEGPNTGDIADVQVFRCDITSAMDPAKPFTSKLYARVNNTLPPPDTCKAVTGLEVSQDSMGAHVTWLRGDHNQNWQVAYGFAGDDPESYPVYNTTEEQYTILGLTPGVEYAVRVRANCFDDTTYSDWCDTVHFVREGTTEGISAALEPFTSIMPNPAYDKVTITSAYNISRITFYDMQGHTVLDTEAEGLAATIDVQGLPSGSYVVFIRTRQGLSTRKVIIER